MRFNVGERVGRLVLVERQHSGGRIHWVCRCDCGTEKVVMQQSISSGATVSCGCFARDKAKQGMSRRSHGQTGTPTYCSWAHMKERCTSPSCRQYKWYGGRGIKVCSRWESFENFLADMGERPEGKTLDRWPNSDGNYEPGNCRWATAKEQAATIRRFRLAVQ